MPPQQVVLASDINSTAGNFFRHLWGSEDFSDVTLATVDGHQAQAHKLILGAWSPLFKNLLLRSSQKDLVILLKDIKHRFLVLVLRFVYLGEVQLEEEDLQEFLSTATDLKISGLENLKTDSELIIPKIETQEEQIIESNGEFSEKPRQTLKKGGTTCNKEPGPIVSAKKNMKKSKNGSKDLDADSELHQCPQCKYKTTRAKNLHKHKWSKHVRKLKRPCDMCEYQGGTRRELKDHKMEKHSSDIFR